MALVRQDALARATTRPLTQQVVNVKVEKIRASRDLLTGIDSAAVHVLRDKQISAGALKVFKKVKAARQLDMARLMVMTGNYSLVFAETLLAGTDKKELLSPDVPKKIRKLKIEEIARLEAEMGSMERNFKLAEDGYSANVLQLSVAGRYVERLIGNRRITKYLAQHHADIFKELSHVIEDRDLTAA